MKSMKPRPSGDSKIIAANRELYDTLWADARMIDPESFNTWPVDGLRRVCRASAPLQPEQLLEKLAGHGFSVSRSAVYGMQPRSSRLLDPGMWYLKHRREKAMWWYNRVLMPAGVRFQKKLSLVSGMADAEGVDELLLVCRKEGAPRRAN
jgi:hypothetical protein